MNQEESTAAIERFMATWPTPKMNDQQVELWLGIFEGVDNEAATQALNDLEMTCKRRPAVAEFRQAYAGTQGQSAAVATTEREFFYGMASRRRPGEQGDGRPSPSFRRRDLLTDWVREQVDVWGNEPGFEVHTYKRTYRVVNGQPIAGSHSDVCLDARDEAPAVSRATVEAATRNYADSAALRDEEEF